MTNLQKKTDKKIFIHLNAHPIYGFGVRICEANYELNVIHLDVESNFSHRSDREENRSRPMQSKHHLLYIAIEVKKSVLNIPCARYLL